MAKFLETQSISSELTKLIRDAKEKIILVSPYLKVNNQIQERLKTKGKTGTLSEIVIVYGKTEIKNSEIEWLKDVPDLKLFEKPNLHAKCYINEDKAIICSMNLYDFSQVNNIEMGILITKEEDRDAFNELIDEINNIKVNGIRKLLNNLEYSNTNKDKLVENKVSILPVDNDKKLNLEQLKDFNYLRLWRLGKSKDEKIAAYQILTDQEIRSIVSSEKLDKNSLYTILPKKKAIQYSEDIIRHLNQSKKYVVGKVLNVWVQDTPAKYDRVKLKILDSGQENWFDTTQELPIIDSLVAVELNKTWFNDYFYIDND